MKKQKKCKVGIPCGKTCIPRNNKCLSEMNEFDSNIWKTNLSNYIRQDIFYISQVVHLY